jgi:hypothetical protein
MIRISLLQLSLSGVIRQRSPRTILLFIFILNLLLHKLNQELHGCQFQEEFKENYLNSIRHHCSSYRTFRHWEIGNIIPIYGRLTGATLNRWKSQALPLEERNITQYIMSITDVRDVKLLGIQYQLIGATTAQTTQTITMQIKALAHETRLRKIVCLEKGSLCTCIPTPPDIVLRANFTDHSSANRRRNTTRLAQWCHIPRTLPTLSAPAERGADLIDTKAKWHHLIINRRITHFRLGFNQLWMTHTVATTLPHRKPTETDRKPALPRVTAYSCPIIMLPFTAHKKGCFWIKNSARNVSKNDE